MLFIFLFVFHIDQFIVREIQRIFSNMTFDCINFDFGNVFVVFVVSFWLFDAIFRLFGGFCEYFFVEKRFVLSKNRTYF